MTDTLDTCRICTRPAEVLQDWGGTQMCRSCMSPFWVAENLMESEATEAEIVPTLAFAPCTENLWRIEDSKKVTVETRRFLAEYPAVDLVECVSAVPVVRMKEAFAEVVRYPDSDLPRSVEVRVLSRFAQPAAVAAQYEGVCEGEGLYTHPSSAGSISWDFRDMHLMARVGPREEIHPTHLGQFREYPRVRRFAFPSASVVGALVRALLGAGQNKNLMFGALLSDLGRKSQMEPETVVVACVLWYLRGKWVSKKVELPRSEEATGLTIDKKAKVSRSEEVARLINNLLLEPLDKLPIDITRNDADWRDATKVAHRFDRCRLLLQKTRDNPFEKRLSTAPWLITLRCVRVQRAAHIQHREGRDPARLARQRHDDG